jgi:DNA-binding IclR family transcriptional regulator
MPDDNAPRAEPMSLAELAQAIGLPPRPKKRPGPRRASSLEAHAAVMPTKRSDQLRQAIAALLTDHPMSDDELAAALGEDLYTVRRRRSDLTSWGFVRETDVRVPTAGGRWAYRWRTLKPYHGRP